MVTEHKKPENEHLLIRCAKVTVGLCVMLPVALLFCLVTAYDGRGHFMGIWDRRLWKRKNKTKSANR